MTDERIYRLMTAIFRDEQLKLRTCAAYRLNFSEGTYAGLKFYDYDRELLAEHTPNQHIHQYGCFGNNGPHIRKAMLDRDYVTAISLCCACTSNMNLTESNTGTFFMEQILGNSPGNIIQMPDGKCVTPLEAVKWLEEQEAAKSVKKVKKETADE